MGKLFFSGNDLNHAEVGFARDSFEQHKGTDGLKYYLVVMYFRKMMGAFGEVNITIKNLAEKCGYSSNTRNSEAYDDFRAILQRYIIDPGYATASCDVMSAKPGELITIKFGECDPLFFAQGSFVTMNIDEFNAIVELEGRTGKSILIGVYLYIKQFYRREDRYKVAFPSEAQIMKGLGIKKEETLRAAIHKLEERGMLYVARDLVVEDEQRRGYFHPICNVYAQRADTIDDRNLLPVMSEKMESRVFRKGNCPGKIYFPGK